MFQRRDVESKERERQRISKVIDKETLQRRCLDIGKGHGARDGRWL